MKNVVDYYKLKQLILLYFLSISAISCKENKTVKKKSKEETAKDLVVKVVKQTGSYNDLKKLNNVEFEYTFLNPNNQKKDISTERYFFDGEVSVGNYTQGEIFVSLKKDEIITQYYNTSTDKLWQKNNGVYISNEKILSNVKFLRKANFYWFTMMQKLLDDGLTYKKLPNRIVNNIDYKIVQIGFAKNVGEYQDIYVLYVNPKTFLVDQFLFTVQGTKLPQPLLMKAKYNTINKISLMVDREIYAADWDGNIKGKAMFQQLSRNIKFNNSFTLSELNQ